MELVGTAVRAADWGDSTEHPMTSFVAEYITRMRMRKIGIVSSFDEMSHIRTSIYCMIGAKLDEIEGEKIKAASNKRGKHGK